MAYENSTSESEWLTTFQELARRSSHEIRNALNGVAVNLEVARSRLERSEERSDSPVSASVAPFARSASEQLEHLSGLTESFLALARTGTPAAMRLEAVVRNAARLADAIARSEGRCVRLDGTGEETAHRVRGDLASWLVVRLLLNGLASGESLAVGLEEGPRLFVRSESGAALAAPDHGLVQAAASFGVTLTYESGAWFAGFPPAAA